MIFISILVIVLSFCSLRFHTGGEHNELEIDGFSKENTNAVKGLLALSIVLCHITSRVQYEIPIFSFSAMGYIGVGCFFFFSGYALVVSAKEKQYFERFLPRRFLKILLPYIVMLAIYILVVDIISGGSFRSFLYSFIGGYPVSNSWYVFGCLYCYFLFWMTFRKQSENQKGALILSALGIVFYIAITAVLLQWGDWWYKTIVCFELGLAWGVYQEKIKDIFKNHYVATLSISIFVALVSYISPAINNRFLNLSVIDFYFVSDVAMAISFTLLLAVLMYKFHFNNPITSFLGTISYEIYLYHGLIMDALKFLGGGYPMENHFQQEVYCMLVFAITICVATALHRVDMSLLRLFLNKGKVRDAKG